MQGPTHRPRGRLRLRFSRLKHHPDLLDAVIKGLRAVPGVASVDGILFAGSVLIQYDSAKADTRRFWDDIESVLAAHGLQHDPRPLARQLPGGGGRQTDGAGIVADAAAALADKLAGKLAERCALAVLAVLF